MNARKALKKMYNIEYKYAVDSIDSAVRYGRYSTTLIDNSKYDTLEKLGIIKELEYRGFVCYPDTREYCIVSWNPADIKEKRKNNINFLNQCFKKISETILKSMEVTDKDVNKQANL